MTSVYKYVQAFSVDIAIGGVIGALFVSKFLGIEPQLFVITELAIVIWLIYTFDHLVDAGSSRYKLVTFRHKVHQRNSTVIWGLWSFALIAAFSLLFKVPSKTVLAGSILSVLVILYFISLKVLEDSKIYHKEISASLIYTVGIFIGPLSLFGGKLEIAFWILFIQFFLLALVNLLVFSIYELGIDKESGFQSLVKTIGIEKIRILTVVLLAMVYTVSLFVIILLNNNPHIVKAQLVLLIMAAVLTTVLLNRRTLSINERYRMVGDAVFFIPALYFLL